MKAGRLDFTDLAAPVADPVFIEAGTPSRRGDGHPGLSYVHSAAREIAAVLVGARCGLDSFDVYARTIG